MTDKEKLAMLEEILDMEEGTLSADMVPDELEEWNSMTKLSVIVMMDDEFGKELTGTQIKAFVKVQDILDFMG
jgi:acyl carrier protein